MKIIKVKVGLACFSSDAKPAFVWLLVECTQGQYAVGDHHKIARAYAESNGYDAEFAFDENDDAAKQLHDMALFFLGVTSTKTIEAVPKDFHVTWEVDLTANSPRAAAEKALAMQRDPFSTATVFDVVDPDGEIHRVDLLK